MPAALKLTRKLGSDWVFEFTWLDRRGDRQQITGWGSPKAFWRSLSSDAVIVTDLGGFAVDENSLDENTFGDFTYRRAHDNQTQFQVGTYRLDFEATLGLDVVPTPEQNYVIVQVLD